MRRPRPTSIVSGVACSKWFDSFVRGESALDVESTSCMLSMENARNFIGCSNSRAQREDREGPTENSHAIEKLRVLKKDELRQLRRESLDSQRSWKQNKDILIEKLVESGYRGD